MIIIILFIIIVVIIIIITIIIILFIYLFFSLFSYNLQLVQGKSLLKVEGRGPGAKYRLCLKWAIGTPGNDEVLMSLLLALNVFCTH